MSMTKDDFEVVAGALNRTLRKLDDIDTAQVVDVIVDDLSGQFAARNPAFDVVRFRAAVNGKPATKRPAFYQHWRAPNDPNGNPQRLYVVFDAEGRILRIIDEGYRGLPPELCNVRQAAGPKISRAEYHAMKRQHADVAGE